MQITVTVTTDDGDSQLVLDELGGFVERLQTLGILKGIRNTQVELLPASAADPTPIERLRLASRAYNQLKHNGIDTIGELVALSAEDVLDFRFLGPGSLDDIKSKLAARQLTLRASTRLRRNRWGTY
jgi:DNA-directed RNA polymerase subunit alpha